MTTIDIMPGRCVCGDYDGSVVLIKTELDYGGDEMVTRFALPADEDLVRQILDVVREVNGDPPAESTPKDATAAARMRAYRARRRQREADEGGA